MQHIPELYIYHEKAVMTSSVLGRIFANSCNYLETRAGHHIQQCNSTGYRNDLSLSTLEIHSRLARLGRQHQRTSKGQNTIEIFQKKDRMAPSARPIMLRQAGCPLLVSGPKR